MKEIGILATGAICAASVVAFCICLALGCYIAAQWLMVAIMAAFVLLIAFALRDGD